MLALNCKGDALAMIKALAVGEFEATRGVTAWYPVDSGPPWIQCATNPGLVGRVFQPQRFQKVSDIPSYVELWESRTRE